MNNASTERKTSEPRVEPFQVISPINGQVIGEVPLWTREEALSSVRWARDSQRWWGGVPHGERRKVFRSFLDGLFSTMESLAYQLSLETGKTQAESMLFELMPLMHLTAYFSTRAERILAPRRISLSLFRNRRSIVHHRPRGVVLVISPRFFPLSLPMGEVIMALLAGNAVLLKPSRQTPLIAHWLRALLIRAGLEPDLFQIIDGPREILWELIEAGTVDQVSFTGSNGMGRKVAELCGRHLIPCSMGLGGKDPAIVCPDAHLPRAARAIVWGAFANSGQVQASVERAYVHEKVFGAFLDEAVAITRSLRQADPLSGLEVDVGAMVDEGQIVALEAQLARAVEGGARVLVGGKRSPAGRMFFEPTILVDLNDDMDIVQEETYGPILPIMKVASEEEAIARANNSRFGLTAYLFTSNRRKARRLARELEAGTVMINDTLMSHAFPETPWGGIKQSGMGRIHSDEGLKNFTQACHVNEELLPLKNPVWYPYGLRKVQRLVGLMELLHRPMDWVAKARTMASIAQRR